MLCEGLCGCLCGCPKPCPRRHAQSRTAPWPFLPSSVCPVPLCSQHNPLTLFPLSLSFSIPMSIFPTTPVYTLDPGKRCLCAWGDWPKTQSPALCRSPPALFPLHHCQSFFLPSFLPAFLFLLSFIMFIRLVCIISVMKYGVVWCGCDGV